MNDLFKEGKEFLTFKIIQSGQIIKVELTPTNLEKKFQDVFQSLLKELKLKGKNTFLSNEEGMMVGNYDFNCTIKEIIDKFGNIIKVYSEKIF
jgi:hypothetical protein